MEADFKIAEKKYLEEMRRDEIRCAEETRIAKEAEDRLEAIRIQDREWEAERQRKEVEEKEEKELLRLQEEAKQKQIDKSFPGARYQNWKYKNSDFLCRLTTTTKANRASGAASHGVARQHHQRRA